MIRETYVNGVRREQWNGTTRTYTSWDQAGVQTGTRAFNAAENSLEDASVGTATVSANRSTIETALSDALVEIQTIIDTANNTINASPAAYVKTLARAQRRMIRLLIGRFDGTA